jgi:hypothetical protein
MNGVTLPLDEKKLKRLERECRDCNVSPIYLSNYYGEGSLHPVSRALVAAVDECVEWLSTMSAEEVGGVLGGLHPVYQDWVGKGPRGGPDTEYLKRLSIYYLATVLEERDRSLEGVLEKDLSESRVLEAYPELEDRFDDDGLLRIGEDTIVMDVGVMYRDHILHYHQLLRGGFSSSSRPNADLTWRFGQYYKEAGSTNEFWIAIDHRRLMPKVAYEKVIELSTWFGARFGREMLDDPRVVGLTVVGRDEPEFFAMGGTSAWERTEFYWKHDDGIKTLEIEEISTREHHLDNRYLNRYLHAERDVRARRLRHFDGAVKVYPRDRYEGRFSVSLPYGERCRKIKLFRIDGDVEVERWLEMVGYFFSGNEMVLEYFDPDQYHQYFDERIAQFREARALREQRDR